MKSTAGSEVSASIMGDFGTAQIHSVVSKMMMEEGLAGSWDQPTRSIVMHNAQPSRLQTLASDLSDRAAGRFFGTNASLCGLRKQS